MKNLGVRSGNVVDHRVGQVKMNPSLSPPPRSTSHYGDAPCAVVGTPTQAAPDGVGPWPRGRAMTTQLAAAVLWLGSAFAVSSSLQAEPSRLRTDLSLSQLRQSVAERNESIQMKMLDAEISRKNHEAERGIFEPAVVGSVERTDSRRTNNVQQSVSMLGTSYLAERNNLYTGGLEFLVPTGGRFRTGYTLRDLSNNLQASRGSEYETFLGASLVQPLLKNFGPSVTYARIRLAAVASEVAFQEYRRQLMLAMGQAESLYWDLYLLQERERLATESMATGEKVLTDNQARAQVGKGSQIEVLQAEAGVSFRRARLNDAVQRVYEAGTRLGSYYSYVAAGTNNLPRAVDQPQVGPADPEAGDSYLEAFALNPDFLIRRNQIESENIRIAYTSNQRLPQVDLKASYGLNGLGLSPGESWDWATTGDTPAWSVGVELRVPITGGLKERREYQAAKLGKEKALIALKEIEVQVFNAVDATVQKVKLYRESVDNYRSVAEFNEKLLRAQLDLLAVGSMDSKTVLETEEKLFEARVAVVESLVLYQKAWLELELVCGSLLKGRDLDLSREELRLRTDAFLHRHNYPMDRVAALQQQAVTQVQQAATQP